VLFRELDGFYNTFLFVFVFSICMLVIAYGIRMTMRESDATAIDSVKYTAFKN
jgi:hypothetical protein